MATYQGHQTFFQEYLVVEREKVRNLVPLNELGMRASSNASGKPPKLAVSIEAKQPCEPPNQSLLIYIVM